MAQTAVFQEDEVKPESFRSKGKNTPFGGWELQGAPVMTILGGRVLHDVRKT